MKNSQPIPAKNKKNLIIVVVLVVIIILGLFLFFKFKSSGSSDLGGKDNQNGIFTSVKDALSKKMTLVCEFNDQNGYAIKSYIKDGAVRITSTGGTVEGQSGEIIMRDKKMYMWDEKTKQGFVYNIPDTESSDSSDLSIAGQQMVQSDSYIDMIDQYKDSCKVAAVEDSHFTVPTDIDFQDMSKFLEDLKNNMPSGTNY